MGNTTNISRNTCSSMGSTTGSGTMSISTGSMSCSLSSCPRQHTLKVNQIGPEAQELLKELPTGATALEKAVLLVEKVNFTLSSLPLLPVRKDTHSYLLRQKRRQLLPKRFLEARGKGVKRLTYGDVCPTALDKACKGKHITAVKLPALPHCLKAWIKDIFIPFVENM
ncbi:hypothetical protein Pelo_18262 [Pelomyxa schiedti]|nr:hypothetical protein Pelo_18262 [Pelomyxa schiedti]